MHTGSFLVAALAAAASVAVAEEMRPRIYFPRHVKRQFTNATITSHAPIAPLETPKETPFLGTAPRSTKRESATEPDFFSSIGDPLSVGPASPSADGSKSHSDDLPVTTVVVDTVIVTPSTFPTDKSIDLSTSTKVPGLGIFPTTLGKTNSSTPTTSSDTGIVIWPTGAVTSSTVLPLTSTTLGPIDSIVSSIVSQLTSAVLPSHNATGTDVLPTLTTTPPLVTISLPVPTSLPTSVSVSIPTVTLPPPTSVNLTTSVLPPISTPPISTPPITTTLLPPPPPVSNTTLVPPPPTTVINTTESTTPTPPPISTTLLPPPVSSPNVTATPTNTTLPTGPTSTSIMTSVPTIGTLPPSQSWLPSTILIQPTPTAASSTPTAVPTGLPQLITPENGNVTVPPGTSIIQLGFLFPLNWEFVSTTPQSAAQLIQTLPEVLAYQAGTDKSLTQVKQLVQFNTMKQYGYLTTLAYCTYPTSMVEKLSVDINIPTVRLFNNPKELARNLSAQINTAIGITLGSTLNVGASPSSGGTAATSTNGVFGNEGQPQTPAQQATTAGLAVGSVAVAVAYGAAMFVVARRYKRKKQSHHRTSSVTNPSEMRHTGSPALMGGALLSRDFTSSYGGVAGGRDSHGSGRSGMNNSGRTAYISAPVAAENSLGWN